MASSRKRSAAAPATPSIAAVSSSPPPSEQPTVVGTPGLSDGDTGDARSLAVRAPNVADVLKSVRSDSTVTQHFVSAQELISIGDEDVFFEGGGTVLWEEVGKLLLDAINKYTPLVEKDLPKKSEQFERRKQWIAHDYTFSRAALFHEDGIDVNGERYFLIISLLQVVAIEFLELYQKLIAPLGGEKRAPVHAQVNERVAECIATNVEDLFKTNVARRVYYVTGFLCNAGANEAKRRKDSNDVGACIAAIDSHFVAARETDRVLEVKESLPDNLASLVDERCCFGGLKYPDLVLYTVFAVVEKIFSLLTTPTNFMTFGGSLLIEIRRAMLVNEKLVLLFEDLFPGKFSEATRETAFAYYLQVFVNVRAKDLCYRYNSNIYKATKQQGVRQTLCAITGGGKKKKAKSKQQSKETEEPDIYPEEEVTPENENATLLTLAEDDIDDGDKVCTEPQPEAISDAVEMITDVNCI